MRLIGMVQGKNRASQFYSFLKEEKIPSIYEQDRFQQISFQFWVIHEEDVEKGIHWLKEFQKDPENSRFTIEENHLDEGKRRVDALQEKVKVFSQLLNSYHFRRKITKKAPITILIILVSIFLYIWNDCQIDASGKKNKDFNRYQLTPLMDNLCYDIPVKKHDKDVTWHGCYDLALRWPKSKHSLRAPLFIQIGQGEIWRLFTPVLLHGSFFHILFNMLWLSMLGSQIEKRVRKWQYIAMTLIIAIVSNTLQYLMSGPFFIGYSGIICGLAGFIWMRQQQAPWEGYPLQKGTFAFLAFFIVAMTVLQCIAFLCCRLQIAHFSINVGNTAHISGMIVGMILGKIHLFYERNV